MNSKIETGKLYRAVDGRKPTLDIDIGVQSFRLVNLYLPNDIKQNNDFIKGLDLIMTTNRTIILGGDFNNIEKDMDQWGGNETRHISKQMTNLQFN